MKKLTKKQQAPVINLKKHDVFYSADKTGDFANTMFFFNGQTKTFQNEVYYRCLTLDGDADYYTLAEPDVATIRQYDPDTDGDFYGVTGC